MNSLVNCPCGHHLGRHADDGCRGLFGSSDCGCTLTRQAALEAAVAAARKPAQQHALDPEFDELSA
jgi:hypothetical protein